jgi:putative transposase
MKKKRFTEEQIVSILRDAEAKTIDAAARQHGVSEQSIYRWKRQFGQMEVWRYGNSASFGMRMPV